MTKLCIGVALVAMSMGCGGGGGGSDGGDTPATPTITVGTTVVAAGESKTISAAVGDTLTVVASEVVPGLTVSNASGKACLLSFPSGIQTNVATYTLKIGTGTVACILKVSFDEGDATLTVQVP